MSTLWKRAIATTTIALVAGLGLTACDSGGTATTDPYKGSPTQPTQEQDPPKASGPMTADDFSQRINDAQFKAGTTHFTQTTEVSGQKIEMSGDMVLASDASQVKVAMSMPGGMEIRVIGSEMYMNLGELTGNKFYQPSAEEGNPITEQLSKSVDQTNLAAQFEAFQAALKDFEAEEGAETIDGVETTKYTLVLDSKKLFEAQDTEIPEGAGIGDTIEYVIYAGEDDLPRRMVMDIAGSAVSMEFSKWGEDILIEAPSADQITDEMPGM